MVDKGSITACLFGLFLSVVSSVSTVELRGDGYVGRMNGVAVINIGSFIRKLIASDMVPPLSTDDSVLFGAAGIRLSLGPPPENILVVNISSWGILLIVDIAACLVKRVVHISFDSEIGVPSVKTIPLTSTITPTPIRAETYVCIRQSGAIEAIFVIKNGRVMGEDLDWFFVVSFDIETLNIIVDVNFVFPDVRNIRVIATTTMARKETEPAIISEFIPLLVEKEDPCNNQFHFIEIIPLRWTWVSLIVRLVRSHEFVDPERSCKKAKV